MKKNIISLFLIFFNCCFAEENINPIVKNVMIYYLEELIPQYYSGKEDFSEEMHIMHRKYNAGMQGNGFSKIGDKEDIIFFFYYLINHDRQNVQVLRAASNVVENVLYEYWVVSRTDTGTPYDYAYFYLTKADSKQARRTIINISKKYKEFYKLENGITLDLSIENLLILYEVEPELQLESFRNTKYENIIVKWRKNMPYLKKMNILEKLYYENLEKSKRED